MADDVAFNPRADEEAFVDRAGSVRKGVRAGFNQLGAMYHAFAGNLAESAGLSEFAESRRAEAQRYAKFAETVGPDVKDYRQVKDFDSLSEFVGGHFGQGLATMVPTALGAIVGRRFGLRGSFAGGFGASFPAMAGEQAIRIQDAPDTTPGARTANMLATGAVSAGLESLFPAMAVGRIAKGAARPGLRGLAEAAGKGALVEGATEGAQEATGLAGHSLIEPGRDTSDDTGQVTNAAIAGAIPGGVLGGGGHLVTPKRGRQELGEALDETPSLVDSDNIMGIATDPNLDEAGIMDALGKLDLDEAASLKKFRDRFPDDFKDFDGFEEDLTKRDAMKTKAQSMIDARDVAPRVKAALAKGTERIKGMFGGKKQSLQRTALDAAIMDLVIKKLPEDKLRSMTEKDRMQHVANMKHFALFRHGSRMPSEHGSNEVSSEPEQIPAEMLYFHGKDTAGVLNEINDVLTKGGIPLPKQQYTAKGTVTGQKRRTSALESVIRQNLADDIFADREQRETAIRGFMRMMQDTGEGHGGRLQRASQYMFNDPIKALDQIQDITDRDPLMGEFHLTKEEADEVEQAEEDAASGTADDVPVETTKEGEGTDPFEDERVGVPHKTRDLAVKMQRKLQEEYDSRRVRFKIGGEDGAFTVEAEESAGEGQLSEEEWRGVMERKETHKSGFENSVITVMREMEDDDGTSLKPIKVNLRSLTRMAMRTVERTGRDEHDPEYVADAVMRGLGMVLGDPTVKGLGQKTSQETGVGSGATTMDRISSTWDIPDETVVAKWKGKDVTWGQIKGKVKVSPEELDMRVKTQNPVESARQAQTIDEIEEKPLEDAKAHLAEMETALGEAEAAMDKLAPKRRYDKWSDEYRAARKVYRTALRRRNRMQGAVDQIFDEIDHRMVHGDRPSSELGGYDVDAAIASQAVGGGATKFNTDIVSMEEIDTKDGKLHKRVYPDDNSLSDKARKQAVDKTDLEFTQRQEEGHAGGSTMRDNDPDKPRYVQEETGEDISKMKDVFDVPTGETFEVRNTGTGGAGALWAGFGPEQTAPSSRFTELVAKADEAGLKAIAKRIEDSTDVKGLTQAKKALSAAKDSPHKDEVLRALSSRIMDITTLADTAKKVVPEAKSTAQDMPTLADAEEQARTNNPAPLVVENRGTYASRTRENAAKADITIAFASDFTTAGERLTHSAAGAKYVGVKLGTPAPEAAKQIVAKMAALRAKSVNIAGNGIYTIKGMTQEQADEYVHEVMKLVDDKISITSVRSGGQTGIDEAGAKAGQRLGIPTTVLLPAGNLMRNAQGKDIRQTADEAKARLSPKKAAPEVAITTPRDLYDAAKKAADFRQQGSQHAAENAAEINKIVDAELRLRDKLSPKQGDAIRGMITTMLRDFQKATGKHPSDFVEKKSLMENKEEVGLPSSIDEIWVYGTAGEARVKGNASVRMVTGVTRAEEQSAEGTVPAETKGTVYFLAEQDGGNSYSGWANSKADAIKKLKANGYEWLKMEPFVEKEGQRAHKFNHGDFDLDSDIPFSRQNLGTQGATEEQKDAVREFIRHVLGADARVAFKNMAEAGSFAKLDDIEKIRIANMAMDHMGVARHEAAHAMIARILRVDPKLGQAMLSAAGSPEVVAKLRELLDAHPMALEQLSDPEERLAYMYQFWNAGAMTIPGPAQSVFQKIKEFLVAIASVWTEQYTNVKNVRQAEQVFGLFERGELSDNNTMGAVLRARMPKNAWDRATELMPKLWHFIDKGFSTAEGYVRDMNVPEFTKIATQFYTPLGAKGKEPGFVQAKYASINRYMTRLNRAIGDAGPEIQAEALKVLHGEEQAASEPAWRVVEQVRSILNDLFDQMQAAGVKAVVWNGDTRKYEEHDIRRVKDYFPRVYDRDYLAKNQAAFEKLLEAQGLTGQEAHAAAESILKPTEQADSDASAGLTYYAPNTLERRIDLSPEQLAPFLQKDLYGTMASYIAHSARRAEYTKRFGNQGQEIKKAIGIATMDQGATPEQVADFNDAVSAWEGTLGNNIKGEMRTIFGTMVTYQNIRLLPLALFSSLVDPIGLKIRGATWGESLGAFTRGLKGLVKETKDDAYHLAEAAGAIAEAGDAHMLAEAYGNNYMTGWQRKINETFFKYNGLESWNRSMRVAASAAAEKFIIRHAVNPNRHSERYLEELNLTQRDVQMANGHLVMSDKVRDAIVSWVDGAVVRPNAAIRPIWMSDPHWMLVSHLKQFVYSFQKTIIARTVHEMQNGNYSPALSMVSFVPFIIASDVMRAMLTPGGGDDEALERLGVSGLIWRGTQRAGLFGPGQYALDAYGDLGHDKAPLVSLSGPTGAQLYNMGHAAIQGGMGQQMWQAVPGYVLVK